MEKFSTSHRGALAAALAMVLLAACSASSALPASRGLITLSGARVPPDPARMDSIDIWLRPQLDNIREDPTFLIFTDFSEVPVMPWENFVIEGDTARGYLDGTIAEARPAYLVYAHLHLMHRMERLEEWLPDAVGLEGYELERAIVARTAEVWFYGRSLYGWPPYLPLDELLFSSENGYLDAYLLTAARGGVRHGAGRLAGRERRGAGSVPHLVPECLRDKPARPALMPDRDPSAPQAGARGRDSPDAGLVEEWTRTGNWLFRWRSYLPLLVLALLAALSFAFPSNAAGQVDRWELAGMLVAVAGLLLRAWTVGHAPAGTSGRGTRKLGSRLAQHRGRVLGGAPSPLPGKPPDLGRRGRDHGQSPRRGGHGSGVLDLQRAHHAGRGALPARALRLSLHPLGGAHARAAARSPALATQPAAVFVAVRARAGPRRPVRLGGGDDRPGGRGDAGCGRWPRHPRPSGRSTSAPEPWCMSCSGGSRRIRRCSMWREGRRRREGTGEGRETVFTPV